MFYKLLYKSLLSYIHCYRTYALKAGKTFKIVRKGKNILSIAIFRKVIVSNY